MVPQLGKDYQFTFKVLDFLFPNKVKAEKTWLAVYNMDLLSVQGHGRF
jgi:hypothetical protein